MKTKIIIAFIALVTSTKAQDTTNYASGPHGGILRTVENYNIETINSYGCITAYLFDASLKVIPNKFLSGTIMFFYNNEVSLNKYLVPIGTDGLLADITGEGYNYYILNILVNGRFISSRYNNFFGIAEKENKKKAN